MKFFTSAIAALFAIESVSSCERMMRLGKRRMTLAHTVEDKIQRNRDMLSICVPRLAASL